MYRSVGSTTGIDPTLVEQNKVQEAGTLPGQGTRGGSAGPAPKYEDLPVGFEGTLPGTNLRCLPDRFLPWRWWKKGYAWTDSVTGAQVTWEGIARSDIQNLCKCITTNDSPLVLHWTVRNQINPSQYEAYASASFGRTNSQTRVDFCWTRFLQRKGYNQYNTHSPTWTGSPRTPNEVHNALPPQLDLKLRVKNFPNPCVPAHHVPGNCSAHLAFNTADSIRRGHNFLTAVERQPVEPAWVFSTFRSPDPAAWHLSATKDRFKDMVDYSAQNPIRNAYQQINLLNQAREKARSTSQGLEGLATQKTLALGAIGVTTVALGGLVYLMTRKKR